MTTILLVDDEQNVLNAMRRSLFDLNESHALHFVPNADQALRLLEQQPVDVLLSDIRMPGMSGEELLLKAYHHHPEVLRFGISGYSKRETSIALINAVHQFFAKPCDIDHLLHSIDRACDGRDRISHPDLRRLVLGTGALPVQAQSLRRLTKELNNPQACIDRIGRLVSQDAGMSAKVLQVVNSAFFGLCRHVSSAAEAAVMLGPEILRAMVHTTDSFQPLEKLPAGSVDLHHMWQWAVQIGDTAYNLALHFSRNRHAADHALIAGNLIPIGLLLLMHDPGLWHEITSQAQLQARPLCQVERDYLGLTHTEIAAVLADIWGFPEPVAAALRYAHHPEAHPLQEFDAVCAVHMALSIVGQFGACSIKGLPCGQLHPAVRALLPHGAFDAPADFLAPFDEELVHATH
jgi:HD-like signal output (HDOD) protein/CheY-like chemotaxis protein